MKNKHADITYNLKAVSLETGLKPVTIRAWERRYGVPSPRRTAGGHRQYTQSDIETIKWLVRRQREGLSISNAVAMWQSKLAQGENPLETDLANIPPPPPPSIMHDTTQGDRLPELQHQWLVACLDFDEMLAEHILSKAFTMFPPEMVCIQLILTGLAKIGSGWYEGKLTVQQEHFASELAIRRLERLIAGTPPSSRPETILVCCAPEDNHTIGSLMISYFLRRQGWHVIYLGADVPAEQFVETIGKISPSLVILSSQQLYTASTLLDVVRVLKDQNIPVTYGGRVFNQTPHLRERIPAHFLSERLDEVPQRVAQLLQTTPPTPVIPAEDPLYRDTLAQYHARRALIEAHMWNMCTTTNKSTQYLKSLNAELARIIPATLKLGDIQLLTHELMWMRSKPALYRVPDEQLVKHIALYRDAAHIYLGSESIIVQWATEWLKTQESR